MLESFNMPCLSPLSPLSPMPSLLLSPSFPLTPPSLPLSPPSLTSSLSSPSFSLPHSFPMLSPLLSPSPLPRSLSTLTPSLPSLSLTPSLPSLTPSSPLRLPLSFRSNPFYEPRTSSPSRPSGGPSPDFSNQKRRAPLPPRPPGPSPSAPNTSREGAERERFMPSGPSAVAAVVGRELAFSSPKVRLFEEGSGTRAVVFKKCVCVCSQSVCSCVCMCLRVCPVTSNLLI